MVEHLLDKELVFSLYDPAIAVVNGGTQWQGDSLISLFDWTESSSVSHLFKGLRFTLRFCSRFLNVSCLH